MSDGELVVAVLLALVALYFVIYLAVVNALKTAAKEPKP